jgi:hypothetical protein
MLVSVTICIQQKTPRANPWRLQFEYSKEPVFGEVNLEFDKSTRRREDAKLTAHKIQRRRQSNIFVLNHEAHEDHEGLCALRVPFVLFVVNNKCAGRGFSCCTLCAFAPSRKGYDA